MVPGIGGISDEAHDQSQLPTMTKASQSVSHANQPYYAYDDDETNLGQASTFQPSTHPSLHESLSATFILKT